MKLLIYFILFSKIILQGFLSNKDDYKKFLGIDNLD